MITFDINIIEVGDTIITHLNEKVIVNELSDNEGCFVIGNVKGNAKYIIKK
jgi:hypothetical protein